MSYRTPRLTEVFKISEANDNPSQLAQGKNITPAAAAQNLRKAADVVSKMGTTSPTTSSTMGAPGGMDKQDPGQLKFVPGSGDPNQIGGKLVQVDKQGTAQEFDLGSNQFKTNPQMSRSPMASRLK